MRRANLRGNGLTFGRDLPADFDSANSFQQFNIKRKFCIGFHFTIQVKDQTFENIQFPGTARQLLGLTMFDTSQDPTNIFSLNINNENIITDSSWVEFTKVQQFPAATLGTGTSYKDEYYSYIRALSGNDAVKLRYLGNAGGSLFVNFYFKSSLDIVNPG